MVRIIIGSKNDKQYLNEIEEIFNSLDVPYMIQVNSCHRNLRGLIKLLNSIRSGKKKTDVIIALANSAANLPAVIAGYLKISAIPVIGVGLSGKRIGGADSLLSIATIPRNVPLLNTGIDEVGMYNAALACLNLLAMRDKNLAKRAAIFFNGVK